MYYKIYSKKPHSRYIDIELIISDIQADELILKLPNWRPGRYELVNFSKNIQQFKIVTTSADNPVGFEKLNKSTWKVKTQGVSSIKVVYNYYANQLDGGACFVSDEQLYFNPVHCCLYVDERIKTEHTIELFVADDWKIATGMRIDGKKLIASDYNELVDCPVIASPTLQHKQYTSNGIPFHIWVQGDCSPDWTVWLKDFKAFSDLQIATMQDFPAKDYHFLIQVLPVPFYHGVEHLNSTVLAIGPGNKLNERNNYLELLGVASHELFHVWNVKTIRPIAFVPYKYEVENYSRSGYVYEGITTYFGDAYLVRAGIFSREEYFHELEKRINKHLNNYGRFNMSVADASFDTWLDGYVAGVPNRKVSIYDEGSIIAMVIDLMSLNNTKGRMRLDYVMLALNQDFGKNNFGYTDLDIRSLCEAVSEMSMTDVFENYIFRASSYQDIIIESLSYAGCSLQQIPSVKQFESMFGFKITATESSTKIAAYAPDSPADIALLTVGDEIISAYGEPVKNNLTDLMLQHTNEELPLELISNYKRKIVVLKRTSDSYYQNYKIVVNEKMTSEQKLVFNKWLSA